jgi:hypothetical protein
VGDPIADGKYQKEVDSCSLAPLRLVQAERQAAQLAVNVWWMLLIASTAGIIPSQNSANLLIARWVREFFSKCVPDHMIASVTLFTGLIGPYKGDGVMWQTRTPSKYASASAASVLLCHRVHITCGVVAGGRPSEGLGGGTSSVALAL